MAPLNAFGTHIAVTAAPVRKRSTENAISARLSVVTQRRANRRAVPMR